MLFSSWRKPNYYNRNYTPVKHGLFLYNLLQGLIKQRVNWDKLHFRHIEITCIDLHQTGSVGGGSDHLQLIKFWPSCAPGREVCGEGKIFGSALLQPARSVCVSLSGFFILLVISRSQGQLLVECSLGQVVYTHVPLSLSSINLVPAQAGKVTIGLVWHSPCVKDSSGVSTYGSRPW